MKYIDRIDIPLPDDFHAHFRRGPAMRAYVRRHALWCGRALTMPNTLPPIVSGAELRAYRAEILAALSDTGAPACDDAPSPQGGALKCDAAPCPTHAGAPKSAASPAHRFAPLFAFKLLPGMRAETVRDCVESGAIAGKYYPAGATTNSRDGIVSIDQIREALETMEALGCTLSVHAEDPQAPVFFREEAFLPVLDALLTHYPKLKIVFEHVSSAAGMRFVLAGPQRLGATVTPQHLLFTLEDMLAEGMNPHLYCKPILKTPADREALREAVFSGHTRIFFGTDSAPHPRASKEKALAAAGAYSSPSAIVALAGLFADNAVLPRLACFVGAFGARFYGLPEASGRLSLERAPQDQPCSIANEYDGCVPLCAGETMRWRIA